MALRGTALIKKAIKTNARTTSSTSAKFFQELAQVLQSDLSDFWTPIQGRRSSN